MAYNLRNRNFLKILDFSPKELNYLLDLARDLKRAKYAGTEQPHLKGKNIALIFEKTSTRTRCAFEVGAKDQGAHVTYLGPTGSQIGIKESMKDTARVLGRMFDGIEYRGFDQATVEEAKRYLAEGHFTEGSMAPKVRAGIFFVENGGKECVITEAGQLENPACGTRIVKE